MIRFNDSRLRWLGPIGLLLFGNVFFRLSFWLVSPPLLVENAVKHNIVMTNRPLLIKIGRTEAGQLRVRNNLQRKNGRSVSNGVGLANIAAKYRMLTQSDILVQDEDGHFTVLLPLLNQSVAVELS